MTPDSPSVDLHLCNSCRYQQRGDPIPCAVSAPAAKQAAQGNQVTLCILWLSKDGRQALGESRR